FLADERLVEELVLDEPPPCLPVVAARAVDEQQRFGLALARLHQRERLESLVVRAESAGEQHDGVALLDEAEFAGEEVFEIDQLAVAGDLDVRLLLERQADIEAETVVAARAALRRAH